VTLGGPAHGAGGPGEGRGVDALADAEADMGQLGLIVVGNSMAGSLWDQEMIRARPG
jgi:hypothetical protein